MIVALWFISEKFVDDRTKTGFNQHTKKYGRTRTHTRKCVKFNKLRGVRTYLSDKFIKAWLTVTLVFFVNELLSTNRIIASRARETSFVIGRILIPNFLLTRLKLLFTISASLRWVNSSTFMANQIVSLESESFI